MTTPLLILAILLSPLLLALAFARLTGKQIEIRKYAFWGLGCAFVFFAIGHFVKTQGMVEMLPAWVPARVMLIYVTGVLELLIGATLFMPSYQVPAARAATAVLVLFFPANIYAALNATGLGGHQWGPVYLLIRAPLQLLLIAWAWLFCIRGVVNASGAVSRNAGKS